MKDRYGIIKFNREMYLDMVKDRHPVIEHIFSTVIPLDMNWSFDSLELLCLSNEFRVVKEGEVRPHYEAIVKDMNNGKYALSFTEIKNQ